MDFYLLLSLTNTHSAKQKEERAEKRDGKEMSNVSKEYSRGFSRKPLDVMASKKLAESPKARLTSSLTDPEPLKEK